jgi:uncharacterized tellurite resistance protein B-like protein
VFGWLRSKKAGADPERGRALYEAVRGQLGEGDDELVRIVGSVAALMICVAYADLDVRPEELHEVAGTLGRVRGLDERGVRAIVEVLREHTVTIAAAEATTYARELLALTDEDFRVQLLDGLIDVAAADGEVSLTETNILRPIAIALGLTQQHYNASQARHRDRLAVLSSR